MPDEQPPEPPGDDRPAPPAPEAVDPPNRAGRLRRLALGRPGAIVAGLLAGALLGGAAVAWRTGELPLREHRVCWESLSQEAVAGFLGGDDIEAHDLPLNSGLRGSERILGTCRITREVDGRTREVIASVRVLDGLHGLDVREWPDAFLSARMVPLGGEVTGMVSPARAWAALPAGCLSRRDQPPAVVDLSWGSERFDDAGGAERRDRLARGVVELLNGVMRDRGCEGRYAAPSGELAPVNVLERVPQAELCDVAGLPVPERFRAEGEEERDLPFHLVTSGGGAGVRVCQVGDDPARPDLVLRTIDDPRLARVYAGGGPHGGDLFVATARCQTGPAVFVARADHDAVAVLEDVFPAYVRAETRRLACDDADGGRDGRARGGVT
ncbi:hypothetical protein [Streptomyces chumphonensis]|uniref:hypothetical protein n=1 Tax=Streptomyces chumphonensis TaxID=1214925 RepID=UPI003D7217D8